MPQQKLLCLINSLAEAPLSLAHDSNNRTVALSSVAVSTIPPQTVVVVLAVVVVVNGRPEPPESEEGL